MAFSRAQREHLLLLSLLKEQMQEGSEAKCFAQQRQRRRATEAGCGVAEAKAVAAAAAEADIVKLLIENSCLEKQS